MIKPFDWMNEGLRPDEIAETDHTPTLPSKGFANRGYYGTVRHNVRAIYQFYLDGNDGNPANLNPLPKTGFLPLYRTDGGRHIKAAKSAEGQGDYRWAAELLDKLVLLSRIAGMRQLLAAGVGDQLGYQAESAPWRDNYLTAAQELRQGAPEKLNLSMMKNILLNTPPVSIFRFYGRSPEWRKAEKKLTYGLCFSFRIRLNTTCFEVKNAVLHHQPLSQEEADAVQSNAELRHYQAPVCKAVHWPGRPDRPADFG